MKQKTKKSKSRFMDIGGGYRAHSQVHKSKKDYNRQQSKKLTKQLKEEE